MTTVAARPYPYDFVPDHTALVIIDMQRDFIEKGGFGDSLGNDVARLEAIVPATARLISLFRRNRWPVIHTREAHKPDLSDCPPSKIKRGNPSLHIGEAGAMGLLLIAGNPATRSSTTSGRSRARSSSTSPARACSGPPDCTSGCS